MNWQEEQDKALQVLHKNSDTEVFTALLDWLNAHWQESMENLSRAVNSDEELKWMHFQAVLFRMILSEIDPTFGESHDG